MSTNRLLITIVNYKSAPLTIECLRSLEPELATIAGSRVTVVENASGDAQALSAAIRENGWTEWVELDVADRNGGFAYGCNRGIRPALASADPPAYFLLLNPDTRIFAGAVRRLVEFLDARPDVGIAGCSYERSDGADWPITFRFPTIWSELDQGLNVGFVSRVLKNHVVARRMETVESQVDWICGACMLIRRQVFLDVGLLDEGYFLNFEETDFCLRALRAGWPCWYAPQSRVLHIGHASILSAIRDLEPRCLSPYWYESRRHYLLKNHGLAYALGADLVYGIGSALSGIRRAIQRRPDRGVHYLRHNFWAESVLWKRNRTIRAGSNR
jgi:N-acetylglucosaminyl-diphospho-decaprenol L-rhamnosyltransferase